MRPASNLFNDVIMLAHLFHSVTTHVDLAQLPENLHGLLLLVAHFSDRFGVTEEKILLLITSSARQYLNHVTDVTITSTKRHGINFHVLHKMKSYLKYDTCWQYLSRIYVHSLRPRFRKCLFCTEHTSPVWVYFPVQAYFAINSFNP